MPIVDGIEEIENSRDVAVKTPRAQVRSCITPCSLVWQGVSDVQRYEPSRSIIIASCCSELVVSPFFVIAIAVGGGHRIVRHPLSRHARIIVIMSERR